MAFRFRFPWGPLLTALAFAGLALGCAWPLLTDYHGHLWLRALINAGTAAVLGVLAWRYSERLTDYVNLHTLPVLRLSVGGGASIWLATQWTAVFGEFAVGTASWWPHLAAGGLFLLVALPVALACVALLTVVETALAARRGGGAVLNALRPVLPHAAAGLVVVTAAGYAAVMLPQLPVHAALAIAPDAPRTSGWIQREQRLFAHAMQGWNCEVLVVPPEAPPSSLDRAARSLIARYLAAELARRSALCVADATLVARALGTRARTYSERRVIALADAIGARVLVRSRIQMDGQRDAYTLTLRVAHRAPGAAWSPVQETQWGPIVFSDELPPEAAFANVAQEAAQALGVDLRAAPAELPAQGDVQPELSLAGLPTRVGGPLANARGLQLLAAMHHPSDVAGEHLWERSLIALAPAPAADPQARVLRARAALHLQRRPYALILLQGIDDAEAQALRAVADGNLTVAAARENELTDAPARLALRLEVEALRGHYGRTAGAAERRRQAMDSYPGLAALLYVPFSGELPQQWEPIVSAQLEQSRADEEAVAVAGVRVPLSHWAARVASMGSAAAEIESGYAPAWRARAAAWRGQSGHEQVTQWDVFDALHAANRAAVVLQARAAGDASATAADVAALGPAFAGHPGLGAVLAGALVDVADGFPGNRLNAERARRLAREVVLWEDGETEIDRHLRSRVRQGIPPPQADAPPRAWRAASPGDAGGAPASRLERYAQRDFDVLRSAIAAYESAGQGQRATELAQQAGTRFRGSPGRDAYLLARAQSHRDLAAIAQLWLERTEDEPGAWPPRRTLASTYLRARDAAQAQRVLLGFPAIASGPRAGAVAPAVDAGELLLAAGETDLARPLLLIAAQPGAEVSGGAAQLRARARVAQLDANWSGVRDVAAALHEQHQDERDLTHLAEVSFLLGAREDGWRIFYEASKRYEHTGPWAAAILGHRLEATKPNEVLAFAKRWRSLSGKPETEARLRGRFLFHLALVDRAPTGVQFDDLLAFAGEKDRALAAHVRGYAAFKRERYEEAVQHLLPMQGEGKADAAALPWLVLALARSGRGADAGALLTAQPAPAEPGFHALLAAAYASGAGGAPEQALDRLWDAFLSVPTVPAASAPLVPAGYQLLETCERLHALTGDARYRSLLVDLARRQQRVWPHAWAFAYEARYTAQPDDRERALGAALFLDPGSELLRDFAADQRQRASARFAAGSPFRGG